MTTPNQPTREMQLEINSARSLCVEAHKGQFRRDGVKPYHTHPFAVADKVPDELKPAALLHDVLEDTNYGPNLLRTSCSERTFRAVVSLTRMADETYGQYIARVLENPDAVLIKIADMEHNLSCQPSRNSIEKCAKWLPVLKEKAATNATPPQPAESVRICPAHEIKERIQQGLKQHVEASAAQIQPAESETDTPRTDKVAQHWCPDTSFVKPQWVNVGFARTLEREVIVLQKAVDAVLDIGVYPAAIVNQYEKRTERMEGWNDAVFDMIKRVTKHDVETSYDKLDSYIQEKLGHLAPHCHSIYEIIDAAAAKLK